MCRSSSSPRTARSIRRSKRSSSARSTTSPSRSSRPDPAGRRQGASRRTSSISGAPRAQLAQPADAPGGATALIGQSPMLEQVFGVIEKVADTPSTVLITGESGTGKELIARALHAQLVAQGQAVHQDQLRRDSRRPDGVGAVRLRAAARSPAPSRSKPGRFELADGGTLFLDEIGEIPVEMQVKLLRALQESEFERVGGIKTIKVDVRLVAGDQPRPAEGGRARAASARISTTGSTSCRSTCRRCASASGDIPALLEHFIEQVQRAAQEADRGHRPTTRWRAAGLPVARQHPRAGERARANHPVLAKDRASAPRPAAGDVGRAGAGVVSTRPAPPVDARGRDADAGAGRRPATGQAAVVAQGAGAPGDRARRARADREGARGDRRQRDAGGAQAQDQPQVACRTR